jgi:hypothetical protein
MPVCCLEDEASEHKHTRFDLLLEEKKKKTGIWGKNEKKTRGRIAFFRYDGTKKN